MRDFRFSSVLVLAIVAALGAIVTANGSIGRGEGDTTQGDISAVIEAAFAPFLPLLPDQELHVVVEVEAFGEHDSAFDYWVYDIWQRRDDSGDHYESIVVHDPAGEQVTHIVRQPRLLAWKPDDVLQRFDVPLEYGVWRRLVGNVPTAHKPRDEDDVTVQRDGDHIVLNYSWVDHYAEEFDYVSRGKVLIDSQTKQIEQITWLVDRPEQEPYPVRKFTFREIQVVPAGSSPEGTYRLAP